MSKHKGTITLHSWLTLIEAQNEELKQILPAINAYHGGKYNQWRQKNPKMPGLIEAVARLSKLMENSRLSN